MIPLLFATYNEHKVSEIQSVIGQRFHVQSLREAGINLPIPEPHESLGANAAEKSWTIYRHTGKNCFSEDSGLEVEALAGAPGVRSARYAGEKANTLENIDKLLKALTGHLNRKARFRTIISLIWEGQEHQFEGTCEGEITQQITGIQGFGYDPVFRPSGSLLTFGEMALEEKNQFSHRMKAAEKLIHFLQEQV